MNKVTTAPYWQVQRFTVKLGSEQLALVTKPGLPSWNLAAATSQLFIENMIIKPGDRALLYGCHMDCVAVYLSRFYPYLQVFLTDHNHTALEMTDRSLSANGITTVSLLATVELPPDLYGTFNVICIQLPKGRMLARRWLVQAWHGLAEDGCLYLAGANSAGIRSVIRDGQDLFGNGRALAYKKGNRVAQFIRRAGKKPKKEWAESPGIAPGSWVQFPISISSRIFQVRSLPGVFSYDQLDEGTGMLVNAMRVPQGAKVLDVGCGYGIIGVYAATAGAGSVDLVDNDLLAIAACRETITLNGITNAQVFAGDLLSPVGHKKYNLILSNPPFHAGHAVNYQITEAMIDQAYRALYPGGQLVIVANRFIRYDHLIGSVFGNVSTLEESGKFRLLSGLKSGRNKQGKYKEYE
jgi:16S rRNA (guanine1207-N2)-methyltransferase